MPVTVIGGDTPAGEAVLEALQASGGELRTFISDPFAADPLKSRNIKVATGDVTDGSHVGGAVLGSYTVVVIPEVLFDSRERSFADSPDEALAAWNEALAESGATRLVWLSDERLPSGQDALRNAVAELVVIETQGLDHAEVAEEVVRADDAGPMRRV